MAKKKRVKPAEGDYCRNRHSGKLHLVTKMSPARGWFQLDDQPGWSNWMSFTPVPKQIAEEELRGKKEKGR